VGLTISHDLSWASHIAKLASKASRKLRIVVPHFSFKNKEVLTADKVFTYS